jgi:hypothetical protein
MAARSFVRRPYCVAFALVTVVCAARLARSLDNGVERTPAMGWNSWNYFRCNINETIVRQVADAIVSSGLKDAGYVYVNIGEFVWARWRRECPRRGRGFAVVNRPSLVALRGNPDCGPSHTWSFCSFRNVCWPKMSISALAGDTSADGPTPRAPASTDVAAACRHQQSCPPSSSYAVRIATDDCWMEKRDNATGRIVPFANKFPSGMKVRRCRPAGSMRLSQQTSHASVWEVPVLHLS